MGCPGHQWSCHNRTWAGKEEPVACGASGPPSRLENEAQSKRRDCGAWMPAPWGCDCPVWASCGPGSAPGPSWEAPIGRCQKTSGGVRLCMCPLSPRDLGTESPGLRSPERPLSLTPLGARTRDELRDGQGSGTVQHPQALGWGLPGSRRGDNTAHAPTTPRSPSPAGLAQPSRPWAGGSA